MGFLRPESELDSLLASQNGFSSSTGSTLTSSTIPGIGSLTGKAIKALGSLALRGLDRIIISTRTRAILSNFPHSDAQAAEIEGIQDMYDVVLELSRPKLYNESIRRTALSLLITQINNGHTHELERALDRWNTIELEIFLRVLVLHSGPSHSSTIAPQDHPLRSSIVLDFKPMILFMCRIARKHKPGCQAVLNVRFLDFFSPVQGAQFPGPDLAEVYHTILYISRRPELQFRASKEEAIYFLINSISLLRLPFIQALELWNSEDLMSLVDVVLNFTPPRYKLSLYVPGDNAEPDPELIFSVLLFLHRIGKSSSLANQVTFRAGYLDILLRLEKIKFPLQRIKEEFEMVLDILRHRLPLYTKEDQNKALDVLLLQITNDSQYIIEILESWDLQEIEELLRILVEKLAFVPTIHNLIEDVYIFRASVLIRSCSSETPDDTAHLVTFIAKNAISDHQTCQVVVSAGFFNLLCPRKEENDAVNNLILDILQRDKHSSLVKEAAEQFLSYRIASGRGGSWSYHPMGEGWLISEPTRDGGFLQRAV